MKKIIVVAIFILFAGVTGLMAQNYPINPIPCFNYQLTQLNTVFQERTMMHGTPTREKIEMDIVISSSSTSQNDVFAKVWVVKGNGSVVKGPYRIHLDHLLSVPIDHGQWGVIIK